MVRMAGAVCLAAVVGACGGYSKLEVKNIASLAVTTVSEVDGFCAYQPVALRTVVTYKDGKQVKSRAVGEKRNGRVRTSEFNWAANYGTIEENAVLSLPRDALPWFDEAIRVSAQVKKRPEVVGATTLRPRFDCGGTLDFTGALGARGGEGEDGGPGGAGLEVYVDLAYLDTRRSGRLVLVRVQTGAEPAEHYIVDPRSRETPFVIDASGGAGGAGGQGIAGAPGFPGRDGVDGADGPTCAYATPGTDGTPGGPGGPGSPGGNGARGGNGGIVHVRFDARFPELPDHVQIRVDGGAPGAAGPGGFGGPGGPGGRGGKGGRGPDRIQEDSGAAAPEPGSATASQDADATCTAADGLNGDSGPDGRPGPDGEPGPGPGAPGQIDRSGVDVAELFADEIAYGLPIVAGPAKE